MDRHSRLTSRMVAVLVGSAIAIAPMGPARAEHRAALVVGNARYATDPLTAPPANVRAVAAALRGRGFTVTEAENLTAEELQRTFKTFALSVPTRGTALVWFSGYAVPLLKGAPPTDARQDVVLLPIDVNPVDQAAVTRSQAATRRLLQMFATDQVFTDEPESPRPRAYEERRRQSGAASTILIVDGCSPAGFMGLPKPAKPAAESLVIYAAPFGEPVPPVTEGLSPLAQRFVDGLASPKPLDAVLAGLAPTQESSIESLAFLAAPASRPVCESTQLISGTAPGTEWVNPLGMVFCWCPPGRFTIGSPAGQRERRDDEPQADVEFPQGFWMAKYELTRAEEKALIGLRKGSPIGDNGHKLHPVSTVVGHRKAPVAEILSALDATAPAGWTYDLPTEAEWEYAARAGTTTAYWFGDDPAELRSHGNFADRSLRESDSTGMRPLVAEKETGLFTYAHKTWSDGHVTAAIVGSLPANPWGLHDVHGNVSELTATYHHPQRLPTDAFCPKAPPTQLVLRGGSWLSTFAMCRSAARAVRAEPYMPGDTVWTSALDAHQGMRLVIRPPETVAAVERGCTAFVPVSCTCSGGSTAAIGSDGTVVVSGTTSDDTYTLTGVVPEGSPIEAVKLELFPGEELPRGGPGRGPTGLVAIAEITAAFGAPGLQDATIPVRWLPPIAAGRKGVGIGVGISANAVDGGPQTTWTVIGGSSDTAAVFHIVPPSRQGADGARWRNLAPAGPAASTSAELPQPKAPIVVTMRFGNKAAPARFRLSFIRE